MANLDTGNTAFMLLCSSLVMLMTPGLAFFYAQRPWGHAGRASTHFDGRHRCESRQPVAQRLARPRHGSSRRTAHSY